MVFKVGDTLKFSEERLREWCGRAEKARLRRWRVVGISDKPDCGSLDASGDMHPVKCLRLKRLDIKSPRIEDWSPDYFEKAGGEEVEL